MTAASVTILCPGPSLATRLAEIDPGSVVIGINRAVAVARCDWWCFGDAEVGGMFEPIGSPRVFADDEALHRMGKHPHLAAAKARAETLRPRPWSHAIAALGDPAPPEQHRVFSSLAALVLAADLLPTGGAVRMLGADMAGEGDCCGVACADGRSVTRWEQERRFMALMERWLEKRSIRLIRNNRLSA